MKKFTYTIILFGVMLAYNSASAAEMFFSSHDLQSVSPKRQVELNLFINTEKEKVNAIAAKIILPSQSVHLKRIVDGNSVISLWVEKPHVEGENQLTFAGIIPGGYQSERGLLLTLNLEIDTPTTGLFTITDGQVLLHDGQGSETELTVRDFQITPRTTSSPPAIPAVRDNQLPEKFLPEVQKDDSLFDGDWFVVFSTQDKGLGIDHYEIQESKYYRVNDNKWQIATSPYRLTDQKRKSYIYIKAIDRAGNARLEIIEPLNPITWYENYWLWVILVIGLVIPLTLFVIILRKLYIALFK